MPKISEFLIGIILVSFITAVFGLFMGEINQNYGVNYDNDSIDIYNQLNDISDLTDDLEAGTDIEEEQGITDILGGFFTDAYNVLKLTKNSFDTFYVMENQAIDDAHLGAAGEYLRVAISSIVLILIVIGVMISAIIKRDL